MKRSDKQHILWLMLWRVYPEELTDTRPYDCYDVVGDDGNAIVPSLTFDEATEIVNVHNKAMEDWASA